MKLEWTVLSGLMKLERFSLEKCVHCIDEGFTYNSSGFQRAINLCVLDRFLEIPYLLDDRLLPLFAFVSEFFLFSSEILHG